MSPPEFDYEQGMMVNGLRDGIWKRWLININTGKKMNQYKTYVYRNGNWDSSADGHQYNADGTLAR